MIATKTRRTLVNQRISSCCAVGMLLLAACGPVAIGAALGGGGGGGGGPTGPVGTALARVVPPFQPAADKTLLALRLSQSEGREVRVRFEYDLGQGRVRVPAASLQAYDPATRAAAAPLPLDGGDNLLVATDGAGRTVHVLWNHAADLGQVERRAVTLWAVFADSGVADAAFGADAGNSVALLTAQTVGREVGQLLQPVLRRATIDPESDVVVDAVLEDRGGDRERTTFAFEYAVTSAPPQEVDFVALPALVPQDVVDTQLPDGGVRSTLTFRLDPLQSPLPLGSFDNLWFRVRASETYPVERSDLPSSPSTGEPVLLQLAATQIGLAPQVEAAAVVDPGSSLSNGGDPARPWPRLPIAVRVSNPSARQAMRVRLQGRYQIDGQSFACTAAVGDEPGSATEFELAPLERQQRFLLWNVGRDEGLGNRIVNDPPYSPLRLAQVEVTAQRLGLGSAVVAGAPLQSTAPAGSTQLATAPFAEFRSNLLSQIGRVRAGVAAGQRTRDLFATGFGTTAQETSLSLNQSFAPLQIAPPPPAFDLLTASPPFTNGVDEVVATDFDPAVPDCLLWGNGQFWYVTWPGSAGATLLPLAAVGAVLPNRGRDPIVFRTGSGADERRGVVFHTWNEQAVGINKDIQVRLTAVVRDAQGAWSIQTGPVETFFVNGTLDIEISAVGGEFDGNTNSFEVVLANLGTEYATAARPGLMHRWTITPQPGSVAIAGPIPLATMPPAPGDPTRNISRWRLAPWRDDAGSRDALIAVRQLDGTAALNREIDVWVLRQSPVGGLLSSWSLLTNELTARPLVQGGFPELGATGLTRVFTHDLDGDEQGHGGSDLMLVFERYLPAGNQLLADVWLYARRTSRPAQWRRIQKDLEVLDPDTLAPLPLGGQVDGAAFELLDVDGDRRLDLVTVERRLLPPVGSSLPQPERAAHCNYLGSTIGGIAGRVAPFAGDAGSPARRSLLPGVLDVNGDGRTDLISGGLLLLANADGSFSQSAALTAGPQSRHRVERLSLDDPADAIEVLVADESFNAQDRVFRITGVGSGSPVVTQSFAWSLGTGGEARDVRALMADDSAARRVKDLVGLVGDANTAALRRGRVDLSLSPPFVTSTPLWNGVASVPAGLALVRRTPVVAGGDPRTELQVQDVVVADAQSPDRIVVFESHAGYAPRLLTFANETVVRIAEGSLGDDDLEDLCVLTEQNGVYRLRLLQQSADPTLGIGQPAAITELARFAAPFATTAVRAFRFDRTAPRLAAGFVWFDDTAAGSQRSEVRLLRPQVDDGTLALRAVRTPLAQPADDAVEVVLLDRDRDGIVEVIGGQRVPGLGLQRLQLNFRGQ